MIIKMLQYRNLVVGFAVLGLFLGQQAKGGAGEEQKRPAWNIEICDSSEPGARLVVSGVVYGGKEQTPQPNVTVYVYHTDHRGYYTKEGNDNRNPRLKGTMTTNAAGEYRFTTIRPAPYPGGGIPAHIHYVVTAPGGIPQYFELLFEGDPAITEGIRRRAANRDFYHITALEKSESGKLQGTFDIFLKD